MSDAHSRPNRREFLNAAGGGFAGLASGRPRADGASPPQTFSGIPLDPDAIVINAKIHTMDAATEAIAVNTYNDAWASGEAAIKGSITSGKLADYVVLADAPHMVAADKIEDIQIVRTVVGGKVSYQA